MGVLLSLMTYGVGFVTRPLGGLLFGMLGDRHGRKPALIASLFLMGVCTFAVGLLPGYQQIGLAAPLLLVVLRLLQGLAVGGEVGGAVLLVAESLPKERRGYFTAWPQTGGPAGNLVAALVFALLTGGLSETQFNDYGWRVAFLLSGALIGVGVWMRSRIEESPLYQSHAAAKSTRAADPVRQVLVRHWRAVLGVLCVKCGENALFYVFTTFFIVYLTRAVHVPRSLALGVSSLGSAIEVLTIFGAGLLSDRFGRRPITALGLVLAAVWGFVLFPLCTAESRSYSLSPRWSAACATVSSSAACRRTSWSCFPPPPATRGSRSATNSLPWCPARSRRSSAWRSSITSGRRSPCRSTPRS
jgi:MFS family permease